MTRHLGRVLVVEDDPDVRRILIFTLGAIADVREASHGLEAIDIIEGGFIPDVVVSDVMMPTMDGFELAQHLKQDPSLRAIPIVFLTAMGTPKDMVSGIKAGAKHYLTKPFRSEELRLKVERLLGRVVAA